jgi:peptide/nickel transport system substrate-binding protein
MFRGFRWQLLALIAAVALFVVSYIATQQSDDTTDVNPTSPPAIVVAPTQAPIPTPTQATTIPVSFNPSTTSQVVDEIPTYSEALVGAVQRLNPLFASLNPVDADISSLIFEGLTRIDEYGEVIPALAKDWVVSFDGLEYVVTLRDDVLWQDGVPFTSADVAYTISLLGDPNFPGDPELGAFWRTVEVEPINDHLVRFRVAQQLGSFMEALRIGLLPYHALQGTNAAQLASHPFNLSPIGTGPYQLETIRSSGGAIQQVDLRVAPTFRQRPEGQSGYALERVSFHLFDTFDGADQALQNGEVDGYAAQNRNERQPLINLTGTITPNTTFAPSVGFIIFNWVDEDLPIFHEQRVRQALAIGLNRDSVIDRHLLNVAVTADSALLPLSWAYDNSAAWVYDPALARELIDTAGVRAAVDKQNASDDDSQESTETDTRLRFSILTVDDPALVNVAQEIAAQWSLLNLNVSVEAVDLATYQTRLEQTDFNVALVEISTEGSADPDVYTYWHQGQYPDGKNYGGANDRGISESLELARRDYDGVNRIVHYRRFQREFVEDVVAIPLYYPLFTYAVSNKIAGVQLGFIGSPADRFMTIQNWRIQ